MKTSFYKYYKYNRKLFIAYGLLVIGCVLLVNYFSPTSEKHVLIKYPTNYPTCVEICKHIEAEPSSLLHSVGNITVNKKELANLTLDSLERTYSPNVMGGSWAPRSHEQTCVETIPEGVAIIVPVRYRWHQVPALLSQLVPLLRKQQLCYRIFLVEQTSVAPFNRGLLFNIGVEEARRRFAFRCVVLHDVDLVPTNDMNPYGCDAETETTVLHLGVGIDVRNYKLRYPTLIGGVLKMSMNHFLKVNGFSNQYWGWGDEDDDMQVRLRTRKIPYRHMNVSVARYAAMPHISEPRRWRSYHKTILVRAMDRIDIDGFNYLDYKLLLSEETELFTHFLVHFTKPKTL